MDRKTLNIIYPDGERLHLLAHMKQFPHWLVHLTQLMSQNRRLWLTSGGVGVGIIALRLLGVWQVWDWAVYDQLFRLRPLDSPEERILIVAIDEPDMNRAGAWPIPDAIMADLLQKLAAHEPRAIGLDVYRDLPAPPGHERLNQVMGGLPHFVAIEKIPDRESVGVPPPPNAQPDQVGFNNIVTDGDRKVRRSLLYWHKDGEPRTSFAHRLALLYLAREGITPQQAPDGHYLQLGKTVFRPFEPNDGDYVGADAKGYQVLVNFRHPSLFQQVSMSAVLSGEVAPHLIRDRIILIGSTAPSLKDFAYIPYSPKSAGGRKHIHGVELHANFISHLLSAVLDERPVIRVWSEPIQWAWILLWSGVGGVIVWHWRSPLKSSLLLLLTITLLGSIGYVSFLQGLWIPLATPLLALGSTTILLTSHLAYQREELKRSTDFLQSVIDAIPDPIFVKDRQHNWLILNKAFAHFTGYTREELIGKSDSDFFQSEQAAIFWEQDRMVFLTHNAQEHEEKFTNRYGTEYITATKRSLHQDAAGNMFLVGVIRDITERKRVEEELRRTTQELTRSNADLLKSQRLDNLTGVPNRVHFEETLKELLRWGAEHSKLIGVLFLDLDGFKDVNDTHSHYMGDLLLKAVAQRFKNCLRSSDLVARWAGDEFSIILPDIKKVSDTEIVAEKIRATLAQPFMLEGHKIFVGASIGTSVYPHDGQDVDTLVHKADAEMYAVKNRTRVQNNSSVSVT